MSDDDQERPATSLSRSEVEVQVEEEAIGDCGWLDGDARGKRKQKPEPSVVDEEKPVTARSSSEVDVRVIGDRGWLDDEGKVVRLEREEVPEPARSLADIGSADEEPRRWWMLGLRGVSGTMLLTVLLLTVLGVSAVLVSRYQEESPASGEEEDEPPPVPARLERLAELGEGLTQAGEEAERWLREYLKVRSVAEAIPMLREGKRLRQGLERDWRPLRLDLDTFRGMKVAVRSNDTIGWYEYSGRDLDLRPTELVFVPGERGLEFDWAASVGAGDLPFADLRSLEAGQEAVMRVVASWGELYTSDFPEDRFRCFRMTDREGSAVAWGYIRTGSVEHLHMAQLFDADSMILEGRSSARARLRLRSKGQAATGQFEIAEVMGMGWVEP